MNEAAAGAVYKPEEVTIPVERFPPGVPLTSQFTAVLLVPETVALNCSDCPVCRLALAGETETAIAGAVVRVTAADAAADGCATLCAVTAMAPDGIDWGAL